MDIFNALIRYHIDYNLAKCIPYIKDGVICPPTNHNQPVKEGFENKEYNGILIFKNGDTLIKRMIDNKHINSNDVDQSKDVSSIDLFFDFLDSRQDEDGVYVYESAKKCIMRVSKINYPEQPIEEKIPLDFIYYNGMNGSLDPWKEMHLNLGTKTRLAIELTQIYPDVHAYHIKRSGYTQLGMGKVTHFDCKGLKKEFFFMKFPDEAVLEYIDRENSIVGVRRTYESSSIRTPEIINPSAKHLSD